LALAVVIAGLAAVTLPAQSSENQASQAPIDFPTVLYGAAYYN